MRIGLFAIARPTFDVPFAEETLAQALASLDDDIELIGDRKLLFSPEEAAPVIDEIVRADVDAVLVLQITFADAGMIMDLAKAVTCPLVIWGYPEARWGGRPRLNSLCGINLAAHALRRMGRGYACLYAEAGDTEAINAALREPEARPSPAWLENLPAVTPEQQDRANKALAALSGVRMGLVGQHPNGFETCRFDEADLAKRFGIAVQGIELETLFDAARHADQASVDAAKARASLELEGVDEVDQDATDKSMRLYTALRHIGAQERLGGFAVRCWPEMFTDYGCAICGALGMLNEDAIPCACEADVLGNVTNLLLQALSGTPPWVVDLVHADKMDDTAVIWHCGLAPKSMASTQAPPRADIHANRKLPLLQSFTLKPGRVTVARLSQADNGLSMVIGGAEMIEAPMSFCGTSGVLRFDDPAMRVVDRLLDFGLEHHVSIVYGDYRAELGVVASNLGIPVLGLTSLSEKVA